MSVRSFRLLGLLLLPLSMLSAQVEERAPSTQASELTWVDGFEKAKALAIEQDRLLIVAFSVRVCGRPDFPEV